MFWEILFVLIVTVNVAHFFSVIVYAVSDQTRCSWVTRHSDNPLFILSFCALFGVVGLLKIFLLVAAKCLGEKL